MTRYEIDLMLTVPRAAIGCSLAFLKYFATQATPYPTCVAAPFVLELLWHQSSITHAAAGRHGVGNVQPPQRIVVRIAQTDL
jgi:hypothetical protein